jgi:hypothetical protein
MDGFDCQMSDRAERIRAEHRAVLANVRVALWHAMACGDLLQQEKNEAGHGNWLPRLAEHYSEIPQRTASEYMRLARHRAEIEKLKSADLANLTITGALAFISGGPTAAMLAMAASGQSTDEALAVNDNVGDQLESEVGKLQGYANLQVKRLRSKGTRVRLELSADAAVTQSVEAPAPRDREVFRDIVERSTLRDELYAAGFSREHADFLIDNVVGELRFKARNMTVLMGPAPPPRVLPKPEDEAA